MRPRDERAHPVVNDALDRGYLDSGREYPVDGIIGHQAANQARLSVKLAATHLGVSAACWVVDQAGNPCPQDCEPSDTPHGVRFRLHSKAAARAYVTRQAGGNPANLRYNPFQRGEPRRFDDNGQPLR